MELSASPLALPQVPQRLLLSFCHWRTNQMNQALIVYLVNKKKKTARKEIEFKHAVEALKKQYAATF